MSDTGTFKSSREEAEKESKNIKKSGTSIATLTIDSYCKTNLSVVDNLKQISSELSSCNSAFIDLIDKDADSIIGIQEAFETFDMETAEEMEIK